jgi:ATP-dependent Clp protease protease subunit
MIERVRGQVVPMVVEQSPHGERAFDIYSSLLGERIVFLGRPIDDVVANLVIAQLLHLESKDATRDISLYINSPGGEITSLFAIYDTMQYIRPDVSTTCVGQAASAAAVLLAAGAPGKRFALPNARVLLHQPSGTASGQAEDIRLQADEITRLRERINKVLAERTKQPLARLQEDTDRDFILDADQALTYGVVDHVITHRPPAGPGSGT